MPNLEPVQEWFSAIDALDLSGLFFFLCFIGALLCVWFMQTMTGNKVQVPGDTRLSYYARRTGLMLLGLALCWAMSYSSRGFHPWAPNVLIVAAVDLLLIVNIVVAHRTMQSRTRIVRA